MTLCKAAKLPPGREGLLYGRQLDGKTEREKDLTFKENSSGTGGRRRSTVEHYPTLATPLPAPAEDIKARQQ
jgi:hypothetical protein